LPDFFFADLVAGLEAAVVDVVVVEVVAVLVTGAVCAKPSAAASTRVEMEASLVMV
jgi:hypothetical protein